MAVDNLQLDHVLLDSVQLHNIAEARPVPGRVGLHLQRVPESVRLCLNEKAQQRMLSPACAEIRCVSGLSTTLRLAS